MTWLCRSKRNGNYIGRQVCTVVKNTGMLYQYSIVLEVEYFHREEDAGVSKDSDKDIRSAPYIKHVIFGKHIILAIYHLTCKSLYHLLKVMMFFKIR